MAKDFLCVSKKLKQKGTVPIELTEVTSYKTLLSQDTSSKALLSKVGTFSDTSSNASISTLEIDARTESTKSS
jgi:hypothetical protein